MGVVWSVLRVNRSSGCAGGAGKGGSHISCVGYEAKPEVRQGARHSFLAAGCAPSRALSCAGAWRLTLFISCLLLSL